MANSAKSKLIAKAHAKPRQPLANERMQPKINKEHLGNKLPARRVSPETSFDDIFEIMEIDPNTDKGTANSVSPKVNTMKYNESFTVIRNQIYVVVGVFKILSHSMKFSKEMMQKGHKVSVALNQKNNLYYTYLLSTKDEKEARRVRNEFRWKNPLKEVWLYSQD
jgi:hypothetical protein